MTKRILCVLMPEQFQDFEFNVPFLMFTKKRYTVDIAGLRPGVATGAFGLEVTPNLFLANLTTKDFGTYDALVIPGGPGSTKYLWGNKKLQEVVRYFHEKKQIIATICYACIVPVQAGILTGKEATVYPTNEAKAIFTKQGVMFRDQGVVSLADDKIITAQGPTFAKSFGQAIIDMVQTLPNPLKESKL